MIENNFRLLLLPQRINTTKTLLSLKDQIIQGLRLSLTNAMPGNYTIHSKYLSITVVSLRGDEVDNFTLVSGRSRFIIPDINRKGNKENVSSILFLEVDENFSFIRDIYYVI